MNERDDDFLSIDEVAMHAHTTVFEVMLEANKEGKSGWFKQDIHAKRAKEHIVAYGRGWEEDEAKHLEHALTRIAMELYKRKKNGD